MSHSFVLYGRLINLKELDLSFVQLRLLMDWVSMTNDRYGVRGSCTVPNRWNVITNPHGKVSYVFPFHFIPRQFWTAVRQAFAQNPYTMDRLLIFKRFFPCLRRLNEVIIHYSDCNSIQFLILNSTVICSWQSTRTLANI